MSGLQQLEDLVPGFKVNLETLKAQDWVRGWVGWGEGGGEGDKQRAVPVTLRGTTM
jgi:hypothetical protein